jgi:uncharacterized SAM-binding protein YcdF (DUF218 family)
MDSAKRNFARYIRDGRSVRKWVFGAIALLLSAIILTFACFAYGVYAYSSGSPPTSADAAIILGAAIERDQPSPEFREKINHGIELLNTGKVRRLILTGGRPNRGEYAESNVAKKYATENGVPEDKIVTEAKSHTTYQNLYYARELAREDNLNSFIIVSSPFHIRRAMRIADDLGLYAHGSPTPASRLNNLDFFVRETGRNAKFFFRHRLNPNAAADDLAVFEH